MREGGDAICWAQQSVDPFSFPLGNQLFLEALHTKIDALKCTHKGPDLTLCDVISDQNSSAVFLAARVIRSAMRGCPRTFRRIGKRDEFEP